MDYSGDGKGNNIAADKLAIVWSKNVESLHFTRAFVYLIKGARTQRTHGVFMDDFI